MLKGKNSHSHLASKAVFTLILTSKSDNTQDAFKRRQHSHFHGAGTRSMLKATMSILRTPWQELQCGVLLAVSTDVM